MPQIETMPPTNNTILVADSEYTSHVTQDKYTQRAFKPECSRELVFVYDKNYRQALGLVPAGHRMSVLDEIAALFHAASSLSAEGKNPREVLNDPLFDYHARYPYLWMHSHVALRAPKGSKNFDKRRETDSQGRIYYLGDYVVGDKIIAEGVPIPQGDGRVVVELNRPLRIAAVVSDGNEPQHTTHWHFDPSLQEVAVRLYGRCSDMRDWCLHLSADIRRSYSGSSASFRLFRGLLEEVPLPTVEYFVKDP